MKTRGVKLFLATAMLLTTFAFQGCGLQDSQDRSQLRVANLSDPAAFVLECSIHITKDGQSLHQNVQTSSRYESEDEARKGIPFYSQTLEQECEKSLSQKLQDAPALCRGQHGASRAIFCSTKKI